MRPFERTVRGMTVQQRTGQWLLRWVRIVVANSRTSATRGPLTCGYDELRYRMQADSQHIPVSALHFMGKNKGRRGSSACAGVGQRNRFDEKRVHDTVDEMNHVDLMVSKKHAG